MHSTNGNPETLTRSINVIQINCSNSNFNTKLDELAVTIKEQKADLIIISESNMEVLDPDKTLARASKFLNFKIEDKVINPHPNQD